MGEIGVGVSGGALGVKETGLGRAELSDQGAMEGCRVFRKLRPWGAG